MRPLFVVTVMLVNVLAAGWGSTTTRMTSVDQIAGFVGGYMAAHRNLKRVVETSTRTVTLITQGDRLDLTADLGSGLTGRYIETEKAAYVQSPLGQEVAPGKTWDRITDHWDAGNRFGPGLLRGIGLDIADSYRVHAMSARTGRLIATESDGDRRTM